MITPETREYRSFPVEVRQEDNEHAAGWIHGRAVVFNSPAVMYTDPETGIEYTEEIDAHAFDECDMSDVIMNVNHEGQAIARTRNKTLILDLNKEGLDPEADLTKSQASRDALEAVQNGLLDKMSFAFVVAPDGDEYDANTHKRTIRKIARLFDVSLVNFPAYEQTSVSARDYYGAKAEAERRASEEAEKAAEAARIAEEKRAALSELLKELEVSADEH